MKACGLLAVVALVACRDADPPVAPMTVASSAPAVSASSAPAPSSSGEKTPESCAAIGAGKPDLAGCKWTVEKRSCVCNGCLADADCSAKAGGTCTTLSATKGTMPAAKVCLYPGDDCFGGATCAKGRTCHHDMMGKSGGCGG